jgi:hypothetical protein
MALVQPDWDMFQSAHPAGELRIMCCALLSLCMSSVWWCSVSALPAAAHVDITFTHVTAATRVLHGVAHAVSGSALYALLLLLVQSC